MDKSRDLSNLCLPPLADISTVLCDNQSKVETLLQIQEEGQTKVLRTIVVMDDFSPELVGRGTQCGVEVLSLQDLEVTTATLAHSLTRSCCRCSLNDFCCSSRSRERTTSTLQW